MKEKNNEKTREKRAKRLYRRAKYNVRFMLSVSPLLFIGIIVFVGMIFISYVFLIGFVISRSTWAGALMVLSAPFTAPLIGWPLKKLNDIRRDDYEVLCDIVEEIETSPVVFFSDGCFPDSKKAERIRLVEQLYKRNQGVRDSEIVGNLLIAKKHLRVTKEIARGYIAANNNGTFDNTKIIIDMSSIEKDEICDNCGKPFGIGERFCGYCGTIRKDIRRRV